MKKGVIIYIIYTVTVPALMLLVSTCQSDNSLETSLSNYDPLLNIARYISFNSSSSSRKKGVYTLSLTGTQSFDSNFWGWETGTPQAMVSTSNETDSTNSTPEYYLSNSGKTLNTIHSFNNNTPSGPQYFHWHTASAPFTDGSFSTTSANTGIVRPVQFENIQRTLYNTSGELAYDSNLRTYSLTYNDTTGLIQSYAILTQNNTTDSVTLNIYGFTEDPRSYSSYYVSSYTKMSGTDNTLVGSVTTNIEVNSSATNPSETYTYLRFDENSNLGSFADGGDLGHLDSSFFDDANSSTIVKIVKTITTYKSTSGDYPANSVVTIVRKYSSSSTVVFKEETVKHYESVRLHKIADYQYKTYNVSGSTESQISQRKKTYSDGFLVLDQYYSQSTGWSTPSSYTTYTRDSQGRTTSKKQYDSSGNLARKEVYTFDNNGRTSTIRSYSVDSSLTETCYNNNKNYTYSTVDAGRKISEISYSCSGDDLSSTPSSKTTWTYNSKGQLTLHQIYTYSSSYQLSYQRGFGFSSNGEQTYIQYYTLDGSNEAIASNRIEYSYDSNRFRTGTIYKNSSGEITSSYYIYSYTYK